MGLKVFMNDRQPLKLKLATAIHNFILCIGSLGMFFAGAVGAWNVYQERGMKDVFWTENPRDRKGLQYWALYIFYLSKFPELIDTVILVLKKVFVHNSHPPETYHFPSLVPSCHCHSTGLGLV
jgi:hypothetical protein